jgi:branched-chain amino acid transport system permease protein
MEFWVTIVFYSISYGALLFLLASGFSLIFGVMRIINVAHGSYYLLGGYLGYSVMLLKNNFWLGLLTGALVIPILGIFMERVFLRRVPDNDLGQVLITMGFALILQDICLLIWGGDYYTINIPPFMSDSFVLRGFYFPRYRGFIIILAACIGIGLHLFQNKTKAGAYIRAAVDNAAMARGMGINVSVVSMGVFALGAMLAGMAGVAGGGFLSLSTGQDFAILPYVVVVVILGGRGSLAGAALGSLVVGLIDNFGKALFPEFAYFSLFAPMVLMLAVRPMGLFGKT